MERSIVTVTNTLLMFNAKATPTAAPTMLRAGGSPNSLADGPSKVQHGHGDPLADMAGPPGPWNTTDPFPEDYVPPALTRTEALSTEWVLVIITLFLLCVRIYFRIYMTKRIKWSDGFAILGWFSFLASVALDSVVLTYHMDGPEFYTLSDYLKVTYLKINYVEPTFYFLTVYAIKGAMLCFYSEMLARTTRRRLKVVIWIIGGVCVLSFLFTNAWSLFGCLPFGIWWSLDPNNFKCRGDDGTDRLSNAMMLLQFSMHLLTDLAIYIFPIFILKGMVLPMRKKIDAGIMFAIGFLTLVNATTYFLLSWFGPDGSVSEFASMWEMAFAITLACAPSLKVFWVQKVGPQIRKVTDNISSGLTSRTGLLTVGNKRRGSGDELNAIEKQEESGRHLRIHRKRQVSVSEIRLVTLEEHAIAMRTQNAGDN